MPSTVIRNFTYDAESQVLTVTFQTRRRYWYLDVPESVYLAMKAAFAKGEFFNAYIRGVYPFHRCNDEAQ